MKKFKLTLKFYDKDGRLVNKKESEYNKYNDALRYVRSSIGKFVLIGSGEFTVNVSEDAIIFKRINDRMCKTITYKYLITEEDAPD